MPLIKEITTSSGITLKFHVAARVEIDLPANTAVVVVNSYATEETYNAGMMPHHQERTGKPLAWLPAPATTQTVEEALTSDSTSLMYGAALVTGQTPIEKLRRIKIAELNTQCQQQITAGFSCGALGGPHHYPANAQDQANLVASVTASMLPDNAPDWRTPFWCCDAAGQWSYIDHDAAQIQAVGRAGKAAVTSALARNEALTAQVRGAQTPDDIAAVIWH